MATNCAPRPRVFSQKWRYRQSVSCVVPDLLDTRNSERVMSSPPSAATTARGVGAVEHRERRVARLAAERAPQHLRRQTRPPHATQHDAVELLSYLLGERRQCVDLLRHHLAHVKPTQPIADLGCGGVSFP